MTKDLDYISNHQGHQTVYVIGAYSLMTLFSQQWAIHRLYQAIERSHWQDILLILHRHQHQHRTTCITRTYISYPPLHSHRTTFMVLLLLVQLYPIILLSNRTMIPLVRHCSPLPNSWSRLLYYNCHLCFFTSLSPSWHNIYLHLLIQQHLLVLMVATSWVITVHHACSGYL